MATKSFDELIADDVKNIFLDGEFSQEAIYQTGSSIKPITVQFFEEPMDKMGSSFNHAWCTFEDMPRPIKNKDTLTVGNIVYGIMEATPDEFQTGVNIYLQKV